MLPRWRDQASILFAPRRVTLRHLPRGLRPAVRIATQPCGGGQGAEPWREPLATLGDTMRKLPRGTTCRVIVSSWFARYALVPFSTTLVNRKANEALATHVFQHVHGEQAQAWACRVDPAAAGEKRVACALDAALANAIESVARSCGLTLAAIEPVLTAGFNRARRRLPASCWFAAVEPGRLALGLLLNGQWSHLASERYAGDWEGALARMLPREALMAAADSPVDALPCWIARYEADADPEQPGIGVFAAPGARERSTAGPMASAEGATA